MKTTLESVFKIILWAIVAVILLLGLIFFLDRLIGGFA
jgi:hypothetical protein